MCAHGNESPKAQGCDTERKANGFSHSHRDREESKNLMDFPVLAQVLLFGLSFSDINFQMSCLEIVWVSPLVSPA